MMNSGFALFALSYNNFSVLKEAPQYFDMKKIFEWVAQKAFDFTFPKLDGVEQHNT
jgi:hypothetical protein